MTSSYHRYQLTYPHQGSTIYKSNSLSKAAKKCYHEFKLLNDLRDGLFSVTDLDTNTEFQFQVSKHKMFKIDHTPYLLGGGFSYHSPVLDPYNLNYNSEHILSSNLISPSHLLLGGSDNNDHDDNLVDLLDHIQSTPPSDTDLILRKLDVIDDKQSIQTIEHLIDKKLAKLLNPIILKLNQLKQIKEMVVSLERKLKRNNFNLNIDVEKKTPFPHTHIHPPMPHKHPKPKPIHEPEPKRFELADYAKNYDPLCNIF